ncbi:MAG TPA: MBL fold metallo-hydrolase [Blastocatellia bacterium]|jgi:glyoxylase-like metal-dependent hydrolase (beta-lactamase superfamily II)
MKRFLLCAFSTLLCLQAAGVQAQQDLSKVEIKATHVAGNIHMLEGSGGNIGVSVGADGILIVDDQFAPLADRIRAALKKLGEGKLKYVLNTHWHGDHTGGNKEFGPEAPIIAHDNVRKRLAGELKAEGREATPSPKEALPVITFDQSLSVHFNGEEIRVLHYPHGHTDGDSVIFFTRSNVVHMGDDFFNGMFPFIDLASGGDVEGYARNVESVIAKIPADAKIIPGHGPLASVADLKNFHRMLVETTGIVRERMKAGKSLDQIKAEGLPEKWNSWGMGFIKTPVWIQTLYQGLSSQNRR